MSRVMVVSMADCRLSGEPGDVLVTYALGSCIAVTAHDPVSRVGGMLHFMLPESAIDAEKARQNPWMFADTAIPLLFHNLCALGAARRRLVVCAAGGAQVMDDRGLFNIGKRNALALRKLLWKSGVMLHDEDLGGTESRSVRLEIGSGRCWLRTAGFAERALCVEGVRGGR